MDVRVLVGVSTGSIMGVLLGVLWAWHMAHRRTKRAELALADALIDRGKRKFTTAEFRRFGFGLIETAPSFKKDLLSSDLIWALSGLGFSFIPPLLIDAGNKPAPGASACFVVTYMCLFVTGAIASYFYRRRLFVRAKIAPAIAAGVPDEDVCGIAKILRASFAETGTVILPATKRNITAMKKAALESVKLQKRVAQLETAAETLRGQANLDISKIARLQREATELGNTLGFVTSSAQEFIVVDRDLFAEPDSRQFVRQTRAVLKQMVVCLGGSRAARAVIYAFDTNTSVKHGYPIANVQGAQEDAAFATAPIERDEPVFSTGLSTGRLRIARTKSPQTEQRRAGTTEWKWQLLVPIPFLEGSGHTAALPPYALLRIDLRDDTWAEATDADHRLLQVRALATLVDTIRDQAGVSVKHLLLLANDKGEAEADNA